MAVAEMVRRLEPARQAHSGSGEAAGGDGRLDQATEPAHIGAMFTRSDWARVGRPFGDVQVIPTLIGASKAQEPSVDGTIAPITGQGSGTTRAVTLLVYSEA